MLAESFLQSIGSSVLWKGLDSVAGVLKHIIIAAAIGLSAQLDVFYMALAFLGLLVFSWANLLDVVAVPDMVNAWQSGREEEFRKIASGLFTLATIGSLVLVVVLLVGNGSLAMVALGFEEERKRLLAEAFVWLVPVILLYIPLRLLGAVLRALRQFSRFYQGEFITAITVLVCVGLFRQSNHVLLWSLSTGICATFIFLLAMTRQYIFPLQNPFSAQVRQSLKMAPGLLVLQAAAYVYVLADRIFVSFLPTGAVSALAYGMTLIGFLPSIVALSGSFITVISEQGDLGKRSERLNDLFSLTIYLAVAGTVFMLMAGQPLIQLMLERGIFTAADTQSVAESLSAYAWMILPIFLIGPLDQVFQIERKIGVMVRRTVLGLVTNVLLNGWFLFGLDWGIYGIALATTISYWLMLLSGLASLDGLGYEIAWTRHLRWLVWNCLILLVAFLLFFRLPVIFHSGLIALISAVALIVLAMLCAGLIYRGHELKLVKTTLLRLNPQWNQR